MSEDDGGPAFPRSGANWTAKDGELMGCSASLGMTLRDYFAAAVLQGMFAGWKVSDDPDAVPALCYAMADAMLKERAK